MKRKVALALAAVVVAVSAAMGGTVPAQADVNPYVTEGTHHVNGRDWRTTCEPYSQTTRCRTEIKATQVTEVGGRFIVKTGWYFNNLTYLPSPRALWARNPLGFTGNFTGADGRKWRTSCDSAESGGNGCRSYAEARVIESYQVNRVWHYKWVTKSIFNNIVQFTAAPAMKPSTPPVAPTTVTMPDAKLRECVNVALRKPVTSAITLKAAAGITELDCSESRVSNLTGLEKLTNLTALYLDGNQVSNLAPLKGLSKLEELSLASNAVSDLTPLASLTGLVSLDVSDNSITRVSALSSLKQLEALFLDLNAISDVTPLAGLTRLVALTLWDNDVVDVAPLAKLTHLNLLILADNNIAKVAPLAKMPELEVLGLWGNPITDRSSLAALIARGCEVWFEEPEWEEEPDGSTTIHGAALAGQLGVTITS